MTHYMCDGRALTFTDVFKDLVHTRGATSCQGMRKCFLRSVIPRRATWKLSPVVRYLITPDIETCSHVTGDKRT